MPLFNTAGLPKANDILLFEVFIRDKPARVTLAANAKPEATPTVAKVGRLADSEGILA